VYLLKGDEEYLIGDTLKRLERQFVDAAHRDFNFVKIICGKDTSLSSIIAQVEEMPVGAPRKVVYLKSVDALDSRSLTGLTEYLKRMPETSVLVMSHLLRKGARKTGGKDGDEKGARETPASLLEEAVKKKGAVIKCTITDEELAHNVRFHFDRFGFEIRRDAIDELRQRAGDDLQHLVNEARKLGLYVYPRKVITKKDVETIVAPNPTAELTKLVEHLQKKDTRSALEMLELLLESGMEPQPILGYINSFLKGVASVKALEDDGIGPLEAAAKLRIPDWLARKRLETARRFSVRELKKGFMMLLRADSAIKSGSDPRLIMELLVIELCRQAKSTRSGARGSGT
jgi:DNA polymerase-3 subunit delta